MLASSGKTGSGAAADGALAGGALAGGALTGAALGTVAGRLCPNTGIPSSLMNQQ
jgi:hypothetical protein